ncbi:hypothetical protein DIPPA_14687 [Diplonema papillatum]|nr:hypothetical protein DIPPA_14687 [Diplonema papillatum]
MDHQRAPRVRRPSADPAARRGFGDDAKKGKPQRFYDAYAERVLASANPMHQPKRPAPTDFKHAKHRHDVSLNGATTEMLSRRLEIAEKRIEEYKKANEESALREHTKDLMRLQTDEQGFRQSIKWANDLLYQLVKKQYLDIPDLFLPRIPEETSEAPIPVSKAMMDRLKLELSREKQYTAYLQQQDAHAVAADLAQKDLRISSLESELFKATVQKRMDDVELHQRRQKAAKCQQQAEAAETKIVKLNEKVDVLEKRAAKAAPASSAECNGGGAGGDLPNAPPRLEREPVLSEEDEPLTHRGGWSNRRDRFTKDSPDRFRKAAKTPVKKASSRSPSAEPSTRKVSTSPAKKAVTRSHTYESPHISRRPTSGTFSEGPLTGNLHRKNKIMGECLTPQPQTTRAQPQAVAMRYSADTKDSKLRHRFAAAAPAAETDVESQ